MSKTCDHITKVLDKLYHGELSAAEKKRIENHLSECDKCAAEWKQYRNLLDGFIDPFQTEADAFYPAVERKLKENNPTIHNQQAPKYSYLLAAAAILLIGLVGGLFWMFTQQKAPQVVQELSFYELDTELKNDISLFFNQSEILFMSLTHLDEDYLTGTDYSFNAELELASTLAKEAEKLQRLLINKNETHLAELVEECGILLRTLDRQAGPEDYESIWMVHKTAGERAIVSRISLEKFRLQSLAAVQH